MATDYDVFILTETWLQDPDINFSEIFCNFKIFREDRNKTGVDRGGGILIAVRNSIFSTRIEVDDDDPDFEMIFVLLKLGSTDLIISSAYIPPSSDVSSYIDFVSTVEDVHERLNNPNSIIAGDFNLPNIIWGETDAGTTTFFPGPDALRTTTEIVNIVHNTLLKIGLSQKNCLVNPFNNTLDLVFSNIKNFEISEPSESILSVDKFHHTFEFNLKYIKKINKKQEHYLNFEFDDYDFKNADFSIISLKISEVDWDLELSTDIINSTEIFYRILKKIVEDNVRKKRIISDNFPHWFSKKLKTLIINKKRLI